MFLYKKIRRVPREPACEMELSLPGPHDHDDDLQHGLPDGVCAHHLRIGR